MKLVYSLGVRAYSFAVRIASLWNPKAKAWMKGRQDIWGLLENWERKSTPVYWFHCASLGEFEQGRPIMEKLKQLGECQLVITFFSPSGYTIRKNYELADLVVYLPKETSQNAKRFLAKVQPKAAFFIKYEFWAEYIFQANKRGVKVYSVSAVFREKQLFFKWYGGYMRQILKAFDHIFVQDENSVSLLKTIGISSEFAGDTRYDRVIENAKKVQPYPAIEAFIGKEKVLVIGSSWAEDEAVIFEYLKSETFTWKVIIAPHEINEGHLRSIETKIGLTTIRYSQLGVHALNKSRCLIIDNIGMLMNVYQYADIAYVGGAFGKGLHNVLEPAAFGVPVIFGNKYQKFVEAYDFLKHHIGYSIADPNGFKLTFEQLAASDKTEEVKTFMLERAGATQKIISQIKV